MSVDRPPPNVTPDPWKRLERELTRSRQFVVIGLWGWTVLCLLIARPEQRGNLLSMAGGLIAVSALLLPIARGLVGVLRLQGDLIARLERLETTLRTTRGSTDDEVRAHQLAAARRAIREQAWDDAESLRRDFLDAHPDDPAAARLTQELANARDEAIVDLHARIAAARAANDPEQVINLRDSLRPLLAREVLDDLDRDLAKWFLLAIHRKLLARNVTADLAALTARIAASLDGTTEGASLRAALPVLRRAAGLCPRCTEPYVGVEGACPACLGTVPVLAAEPLPVAREPDPEDEEEPRIRDEFDDAFAPED